MSFLYGGHYLVDIKIVAPTKDTPTQAKLASSIAKKCVASKSPIKQMKQNSPETRKPSSTSSGGIPSSPSSPMHHPFSPPPSVLPKTARAIARKFESDFADKRSDVGALTPNHSLTRKLSSSTRPDSAPNQTPPQTPPPVPTSSRPPITKTFSHPPDRTPPDVEQRKSRSNTTRIEPASLAKPLPLSSSETTSASSKSSTRPPMIQMQTSCILTSQSKYQMLLRDRAQSTSGSIRVTSGPNFSFYVS